MSNELIAAAQKCDVKEVKRIIGALPPDADINFRDAHGVSAFYAALIESHRKHFTIPIFRLPAPTPFSKISIEDRIETLDLLLKAGADIHERADTYSTKTAIQIVASSKNPKTFHFRFGAPTGGITSFSTAASYTFQETEKLVTFLISKGANPNEIEREQQGAFLKAIQEGLRLRESHGVGCQTILSFWNAPPLVAAEVAGMIGPDSTTNRPKR